MDDIARGAEVNKALIYYYFKSKEEILEALLERFFREAAEKLMEYTLKGGLTAAGKEAEILEEEFLEFYESREDILRILLMESLKQKEGDVPVFRLIDLKPETIAEIVPDMEKLAEELKVQGISMNETDAGFMLTEFFTGVIPTICFVVFRRKWAARFGLPPGANPEPFH